MTRDFSPGKVVFRRNPVGSQGKSTRHGGKDLSNSVSTVFRYTQRCVQKGNRPCAQRHTRTDSKSTLPPSAGLTRVSPHLLSLERIWYYIKVLTHCQYFYIHFSPEFPQIREGARGNLRFPRFFRRQRKKNIKSFFSGHAPDKNTLTCASRDAHNSDRRHWWWGGLLRSR